nr:hypothetical protein [Bordetella parapertussis]
MAATATSSWPPAGGQDELLLGVGPQQFARQRIQGQVGHVARQIQHAHSVRLVHQRAAVAPQRAVGGGGDGVVAGQVLGGAARQQPQRRVGKRRPGLQRGGGQSTAAHLVAPHGGGVDVGGGGQSRGVDHAIDRTALGGLLQPEGQTGVVLGGIAGRGHLLASGAQLGRQRPGHGGVGRVGQQQPAARGRRVYRIAAVAVGHRGHGGRQQVGAAAGVRQEVGRRLAGAAQGLQFAAPEGGRLQRGRGVARDRGAPPLATRAEDEVQPRGGLVGQQQQHAAGRQAVAYVAQGLARLVQRRPVGMQDGQVEATCRRFGMVDGLHAQIGAALAQPFGLVDGCAARAAVDAVDAVVVEGLVVVQAECGAVGAAFEHPQARVAAQLRHGRRQPAGDVLAEAALLSRRQQLRGQRARRKRRRMDFVQGAFAAQQRRQAEAHPAHRLGDAEVLGVLAHQRVPDIGGARLLRVGGAQPPAGRRGVELSVLLGLAQ